MDLVDEQHIAGFQISQQCRQVAGFFQHRTRGLAQIDLHFVGDDVRQRRLAQTGRAEYQGMVQRFTATAGGVDEDFHLFAHRRLAHIVGEPARADGAVQRVFFIRWGWADQAIRVAHAGVERVVQIARAVFGRHMARVLDMDIGTFATDGEKTGVSKVDFIIGGCCYLVLPCRLKHNLAGSLQPERALGCNPIRAPAPSADCNRHQPTSPSRIPKPMTKPADGPATAPIDASRRMADSAPDETGGRWSRAWIALRDRRVVTMLFLGFSAGIPLLLIFSSLSLWLREAGIERNAVTFFSWAALGYSFKFVWAPLVDRLPLPWLTKRYGRRRSWLLLAQISIITAIVLMASVDPASGSDSLLRMALAAAMLGFSAATQDICIDAYRIESAPPRMQAMLSSAYIAGYRIGMVTSGAGALFLASLFLSSPEQYSYTAWSLTYTLMAGTMLVGVITTLIVPEPDVKRDLAYRYAGADYARLVAVFACAAAAFAGSFFFSSVTFSAAGEAIGGGALTSFCWRRCILH